MLSGIKKGKFPKNKLKIKIKFINLLENLFRKMLEV